MKELQNNDYNATKNELRERVMMMYAQNMGLITLTIAAWAAVATILTVTQHDSEATYGIIYPLIYFLLFTPALLAVPLSVKSGDNLTRVAQLAAYIRVFHELKNLVHYKNGDNICMYESAFKPIGHGKRIKYFNLEFPFIVILSFLAISLFMISGFFILKENMDLYIASPIIAGVLLISLIFIFIYVYHNSSTTWNFSRQRENSENEYIEVAKLIGVITEDDEKAYREYLKTASEQVFNHRVNEYVKNNIEKLRKKL